MRAATLVVAQLGPRRWGKNPGGHVLQLAALYAGRQHDASPVPHVGLAAARHLPVTEDDPSERLLAKEERRARWRRLAAATRHGTQERRLVAFLRADPDLTVPEAATLLGVTPTTVRVMASRLKRKVGAP